MLKNWSSRHSPRDRDEIETCANAERASISWSDQYVRPGELSYMRTENFNLPLEIIPRLKAWAIRPAPINPIGIFKNLFFFCFLHWKLEFLWVLFTSVKGGSHVVEGWIEPAQAGAFKIDERYHAARECSAFFTIETKRSGKLPSSARAERHNFILSGKTYITFSTKFLCIFPCVIISCKRTKFSSNELLEKFDNIRKRRNKCITCNRQYRTLL